MGGVSKTLSIAEGVQGTEIGHSEGKKRTMYLRNTMCIFLFVLLFYFFSNELNYNRQVMATAFGWRFSGGSQNPDCCSFFNIREKGDGRGVWDCGWYTYDDRRERPAVRNKPGWKTNVEARESRSFGLCGGSFSGNGLGNDSVFRSKVLRKLLS